MTLALIQRRFLGAVTAIDETGIADWPTDMRDGLVVYRTAYRARLVDCLRGAFDKCRKWIGDESFDAAAAHHLILHPPSSWTLDDLGRGFSDTLGMLFPDDPEVEELAWLEWEMEQIFTSRDVATLDAADFAERASSFTEEDWLNLRLAFVPTLSMRCVATDCAALWTAIEDGLEMPALEPPADTSTLLIWRHALKSRFRLLGASEASSLALMRSGGTFEQLCAALVQANGDAAGVEAAGTMLGRWVTEGLVADEPLMVADRAIDGPRSPSPIKKLPK